MDYSKFISSTINLYLIYTYMYTLLKLNCSNVIVTTLLVILILIFLFKYFNNVEHFKIASPDNKNYICSSKCCTIGWKTPNDNNDPNIKDYNSTMLNCNDGIHNTGCICAPNK